MWGAVWRQSGSCSRSRGLLWMQLLEWWGTGCCLASGRCECSCSKNLLKMRWQAAGADVAPPSGPLARTDSESGRTGRFPRSNPHRSNPAASLHTMVPACAELAPQLPASRQSVLRLHGILRLHGTKPRALPRPRAASRGTPQNAAGKGGSAPAASLDLEGPSKQLRELCEVGLAI